MHSYHISYTVPTKMMTGFVTFLFGKVLEADNMSLVQKTIVAQTPELINEKPEDIVILSIYKFENPREMRK